MHLIATYEDGDLIVTNKSEHSTYSDLSIRLDICEAFKSMSDEDQDAMLDGLMLEDRLLDHALHRLAKEGEAWGSKDNRTREDWLVKIGAVHSKDVANAERRASEDRIERHRVAAAASRAAWALRECLRDAGITEPPEVTKAIDNLWHLKDPEAGETT
jgi:hypothetical protein